MFEVLYVLVVHRGQSMGVSWGSYTQEFQRYSWLMVAVFLLLVPHLLLLVVRYSPSEYLTAVTLADGFTFTLGTLTQQGESSVGLKINRKHLPNNIKMAEIHTSFG